jgi:hypothetical protein
MPNKSTATRPKTKTGSLPVSTMTRDELKQMVAKAAHYELVKFKDHVNKKEKSNPFGRSLHFTNQQEMMDYLHLNLCPNGEA